MDMFTPDIRILGMHTYELNPNSTVAYHSSMWPEAVRRAILVLKVLSNVSTIARFQAIVGHMPEGLDIPGDITKVLPRGAIFHASDIEHQDDNWEAVVAFFRDHQEIDRATLIHIFGPSVTALYLERAK